MRRVTPMSALEHNCYIGVAFLRGNPRIIGEQVVMRSTWGPFVHTEIFIQKGQDVRFYSASSPRGEGLVPSARLPMLPSEDKNWELVRFPLVQPGGYKLAYALLLQIMAMQLPYNSRDLWQCCMKLMLPFERDLDCDHLDTWRQSGVFCSQVCLLVLRRLARRGALVVDPAVTSNLEASNSRGCSPNALYGLLSPKKHAKKRGEISRVCAWEAGGFIQSPQSQNACHPRLSC
jgi:hypothetical protein